MSKLSSTGSRRIWRVAAPFALAVALIWGVLSAQAAPGAAQIYLVSGVNDSTPAACSPSIGGYLCPTLRSAVIAANANPGWDTIVLTHGKTYNLTIPSPTLDDSDAATGDLDITGHVNINFGNAICLSNCGAVIQGGPGWGDRLFDIPANIQVDMTLLTLRNGVKIPGWGGAIHNSGTLTLSHSLVTHNTSGAGGGIYNEIDGTLHLIATRLYTNTSQAANGAGNSGGLGNDGVAYLTDVTIDQNLAAGQGGGVGNDGRLLINGGVISGNVAANIFSAEDGGGGLWTTLGGGVDGGLMMTATQILYNRTSQGGGGGLAIGNDSVAVLTGVTIARNWIPDYSLGGGLYIQGNVTLTQSTVVTNTGGEGGGIAVFTGSAVTLTQVIVSGNISRDRGGGLHISAQSQVSAQDSQITANLADFYGGGIDNAGTLYISGGTVSGNTSRENGGGISNDSTLWLINSTLSGNFADKGGGGLFNRIAGSTAYLNNVTVVNNLADADANGSGQGGGLWASLGTLSIVNTLIAQNTSLGVNSPDCSGTLNSGGYNLIQNTQGCTITGTLTGNILGQSPKIGPLKNNGGATWTHALLPGSPAIDKGNPSGTFLDTCLNIDQRGVHRPIGPRCDIGAYEANRVLSLPLVQR